MNKEQARRVADFLTWMRIVAVAPITVFAVLGMRWWVFGLYIAAAFTDYLDGVFARRGTPPATNTDLDGIADLVLSIATLAWLWLLVPGFVSRYWIPYLPVFLGLEAYMTFVRARYPAFSVPHLQFGRFAMALFFFLLPVMIIWGDIPWFVHSVLIIGVASKLQLARAFWMRSPAD